MQTIGILKRRTDQRLRRGLTGSGATDERSDDEGDGDAEDDTKEE